MANEILCKTNNITLDWADVAGATKYECQVSLYRDFVIVANSDNNLATSTFTFVNAYGNHKFYWRWRPYIATWQTWRATQSYHVNTAYSVDVSVADGKWTFIDKATLTDTFSFDTTSYPNWQINYEKAETVQRGRAGQLIISYIATKERIVLKNNSMANWVTENDKNEILRFYDKNTSFHCARAIFNGTEYIRNSVEVCFGSVLSIAPLASGREDNFLVTFELNEV